MPNHVENNIKLSGDPSAIRRMLEAIKSDEYGLGTIDFNKVTPMPESLKIEAGSRTDRGLKAYKDFVNVYTLAGTMNLDKLDRIPRESEEIFLRQRTDIDRKDWEFGRTAWNNIRQYGSPTWYEWSIGHWGTKWNAYGYDKSQDYSQSGEIWFQTAWGAPHPVIQKLAERFPEISFEHEWADEDIGNNCGRYTYSDGERIEEYYPEGKAAMDFAFNVWGHDPLDYDLFENSTGTAYINIEDADYELVDVMGVPALFTNDRLTAADIPKGMYCYDIRDDGTGENLTLEPYARVNHFASIVTKIPINFNGEDHILLTGDDEIGFYAQECTFGQFMDENFTILQDQNNGGISQ